MREAPDSDFSYRSIDELLKSCIHFHHKSIGTECTEDTHGTRVKLSKWIHRFHEDAETLTHEVEQSIRRIEDRRCMILMTAHQPNMFAYSGVLRKATLMHVLGKRLMRMFRIPVVEFFGIADQDFTDDRWVRSAHLPDVDRREGVLELRCDIPQRLMLNKAKLPRESLAGWRKQIETWMANGLASIVRKSKDLGFQCTSRPDTILANLQEFWSISESSFLNAENCADFSSFLMSKIVNAIWGYDTLFSRFSECQQILENEFCFLLSHFQEYSSYVKASFSGPDDKMEHDLIPFWYHCDCGSKARLEAELQDAHIFGNGRCMKCGKPYHLDFGSADEPDISEVSGRISARALSMPLIFFPGLKVCCYVGGTAGRTYLQKARRIGEDLRIPFPPIVVWGPIDTYLGLGQLEALLTFRTVTGKSNLSEYSSAVAELNESISGLKEEVERLKSRLAPSLKVDEVKRQSILQNQERAASLKKQIALLCRNLKLLENVEKIRTMHPCIVDYALNIGLRSTSDQWVTFLEQTDNLSSNVSLKTCFTDSPDQLVRLDEDWKK